MGIICATSPLHWASSESVLGPQVDEMCPPRRSFLNAAISVDGKTPFSPILYHQVGEVVLEIHMPEWCLAQFTVQNSSVYLA